ncbi:MaoC family dehydratase [Sulfitobacter sp. M57]|uniref:MaoC family dehydratase n=1 Tax=unclassified Sulfitobacter TaxID=196795 RepID=UPI0023E114FA|nr:MULTISPECIES: MaoC family dehydratase [unclassified Sulfitobacter]MDF3416488.1 MaoC family dehydratase [Sulfitobacter sp. KE5]MDF3423957.1 MaoC family dehydratase [Sulfitobacter sp. KE43]MDF3435058.1 MaoC family dehydratase [Sulfitobacter sp. KE42]MDF3460738.1 MaoC family dehydratase [Sulfitobacter sp. S74]MDF3464577.1 MaoC family dehydratase [Sulfitobacter sp. Ks18]
MSSLQTALSEAEKQIGTEVGVSNWITVDQPMIDQFAQTTQDTQWIHTDPERAAAETPFGGTIAHGFLTLSLASRFAYDCFAMLPGQVMGINYGMNKIRFLMPVRAGSRLRGRFTLKEVKARSKTDLLRTNILTIEIEGEETPAVVAEWLGLAVFKD